MDLNYPEYVSPGAHHQGAEHDDSRLSLEAVLLAAIVVVVWLML